MNNTYDPHGVMGTRCPRCNEINVGGSYSGLNQVCTFCGHQYHEKVGYIVVTKPKTNREPEEETRRD